MKTLLFKSLILILAVTGCKHNPRNNTEQLRVNKTIDKVISSQHVISCTDTTNGNYSCTLLFDLKRQPGIVSIEYTPECWAMFPLKITDKTATIYWDVNIDSKYDFDVVKVMNAANVKYKGKPFMVLELINDSLLIASYPIPELIEQLNATEKNRKLFTNNFHITTY